MLNVASTEPVPVDEPYDGRTKSVRGALASIAVWLIPALVAFAVGWWGILRVGISRDETATLDISTRTLPQIARMAQHADTVHALYYVILHLWTGVFGTTLLSIRLPSLIGTAIAASLLAILGRMLVSARAGFTAGLLFACSPEISSYAHDARSYGMDSALVIALVMVFVQAMRSPRMRVWIWYALTLILTVVMHLFTLLIVPAQGITIMWYARSQRDWRPLRRWLLAAAVAGLVLSPFVLRAVGQGGTASWIPPLTWHAVGLFISDLSGGSYLIIPMLVLAAFAARMPRRPSGNHAMPSAAERQATPSVAGNRAMPSVMKVALPWLVVPPLLLFVFSILDPLYVFRYLLYCLPALVLLSAAGMDRLRGWIHAVVLVALIAAMIPLQLAVRDPLIGANDFRGEAAYLAAHKRPGDAIVFLVPTQRELANSDRSAYAGLDDIGEAQTPAQAANFSGTNVPDAVLRTRLDAVDRVWAIVYWMAVSQRPAAHVMEKGRYRMFKATGLRWMGTARFRGGAILLFARRHG